jgi:hypothetical protein
MSETTSNEAGAPRRTHRVYSLELKQQIVLETLQPGSSVSAVSRKHGINDNTLLKESDTPIKRHIKIRAGANPHNPQWASYFESRWGQKILNSARGRRKLYRVWVRQDGMCSNCQQPITMNTRWGVTQIVQQATFKCTISIAVEIRNTPE